MADPDYMLRRFDPRFAVDVASWVRQPEELFHLAPSTSPPLTAKKVLGWARPMGHPLMLVRRDATSPRGYAELNPMRKTPEHLWIGHVIVDPDLRGRGIGRVFIEKLVRVGFEQLGAQRISLVVFLGNTPAVCCYTNAGFEPRGEELHCFGSSRRRHRMLRFEMEREARLEPASAAAQDLRHTRPISPGS